MNATRRPNPRFAGSEPGPTNDELFNQVVNAMAWGQLGPALAAADELCRGYSAAQLQALTDRIEQYNSYVLAGAA